MILFIQVLEQIRYNVINSVRWRPEHFLYDGYYLELRLITQYSPIILSDPISDDLSRLLSKWGFCLDYLWSD